MFDDLETAEKAANKASEPSAKKSDGGTGLAKWAHFPAGLAFALLILPLHRHPWGWQIAIVGSYTVYVFWFALGSGKADTDDILGDQELPRKVGALILPHLIVLAVLVPAVSEWFHVKPLLPTWATQEGGRGSFWMQLGFLLLAISAVAQGFWMARRIHCQFRDSREPD